MAHKLRPAAAADKNNLFLTERPPRADSFMRLLGARRMVVVAVKESRGLKACTLYFLRESVAVLHCPHNRTTRVRRRVATNPHNNERGGSQWCRL